MPALFWSTPEDMETILRKVAAPGPIQRWRCPCDAADCKAYVLHAKAKEHSFCFVATQSFQPDPPYPVFCIDNIEDFNAFLADDNVDAYDRMMFGMWFQMGLREAILST